MKTNLIHNSGSLINIMIITYLKHEEVEKWLLVVNCKFFNCDCVVENSLLSLCCNDKGRLIKLNECLWAAVDTFISCME